MSKPMSKHMTPDRPAGPWHARAGRHGFLRAIPGDVDALEIGPFDTPVLTGPRVRYADVLDTDALRTRAAAIGRHPDAVPQIHFVTPGGDMAGITDQFDVVISAHCIEHQPDLIHHLRQVTDLLRPGGAYHLLIPDKRYCFDHFLPESHLADVLQAHHDQARIHTLRSVIEHRAYTTHNTSWRHWLGAHGPAHPKNRAARITKAIDEHRRAAGGYVDVHAWQFTPASFLRMMRDLGDLDLISLRPAQVWATRPGFLEFTAILQKP